MTTVRISPLSRADSCFPRPVRWLLATAVALTLVQVVEAGIPGRQGPDLLGVLVLEATCLLVASLVAWRAVVREENRTAWACLAAGLGLYALGFVVYVGVVEPLGLERYPSPADLLWLAFYPLVYVTLLMLTRTRARRWHWSLWLDGVIAALGLAGVAVEAAHVLGGEAAASRLPATMTTMVYPTADLVLLALVLASFALLGWRAQLSLLLLGSGLLVLVAGDVAYLLEVNQGGQMWSPGMAATWSVAVVLMAAAAWCDRGDAPLPPHQGWMLLLQPVFFVLLGAGLLAHESLARADTNVLTVVLAFASVTGACARMVLTYREVRALADVREQARTDELTGLGNRRHLSERLRELEGTPFALLLIDLDRFKEINDSFGHAVGDQLLVALADRIRVEVTEEGLVARMGGDEFGIVLPRADEEACSELVRRVQRALQEPFEVGGMALHVELSVGAAVCADGTTEGPELLRNADIAMYAAKRAHSGFQVYERGTEEDARNRLQTLEDLRTALTGEELVAHYQPQLDLRTGRIAGVEALVRWDHPTRGLLGPGAFLDVAQHAGLLGQLFVRITRCALADARGWWDAGMELEVSVNVSAVDIQDLTLPDTVAALLREAGLPGSVLKIEVTESVLMDKPERGRQVIERLRGLGVRLSLDDFGTGYSSLSYLPSLPVQELKLDRSFIAQLSTDRRMAAIVRSTLDLARELELTSVAEGIEDPEALALLADWGCDVAQGYYIAKPMPAPMLERWLGESPWLTGDVQVAAAAARA